MARPIKTFSSTEAINIIRTLWLKSGGSDWYDFQKNLQVNNAGMDADSISEQLAKTSEAAKTALDVIFRANDKTAAPAALRIWIDTYLSAEGWKRVQAAIRQHKSAIKNRDLLTKMDKEASGDFSYLSKTVGMTKKDYLSALARWMLNAEAGQKAAQAFAANLS